VHTSLDRYLLHFVEKGELWHRIGNKTYIARSGDACLMDLGQEIVHGANRFQPGPDRLYQQKQAGPQIYHCFAYRKRTASDCLVWAMVPLAVGQKPPALIRLPVEMNGQSVDPHRATAIQLTFPNHTDTLCVSHTEYDTNLAFGSLSKWGIIAWQRTRTDGTRQQGFDYSVRDGICGR
jgi:hypothetical protein